MAVISFVVTEEQAAEAREYALRKGYGRPGALARVAMFQMMHRYPQTGRGGSDGQGDGARGKGRRDVRPDGPGGPEIGGAA